MNHVLVRRMAHVGLVITVSAALFAACGGGSSSSAPTTTRVKNAALPTTTVEGEEGSTETTVEGATPDTSEAPAVTEAPSVTEAPGVVANQASLSAGQDGDAFGGAVVVSADGSTLAVGSLRSKSDQGSVTVFGRSGGKWVQQKVLADANGAAKDWFGYSMAISKDGNTLAIGAVYADVSGKADQGNVLVYARSGSAWTLQETLIGKAGAAGDVFGVSVALSADGNTVAVGAAGADVGNVSDQGSTSVFVRSGAQWSLQQVLTVVGGETKANYGSSLSLSSDGDTLAVGGPNAGKGSVVVFSRANGTWS